MWGIGSIINIILNHPVVILSHYYCSEIASYKKAILPFFQGYKFFYFGGRNCVFGPTDLLNVSYCHSLLGQ